METLKSLLFFAIAGLCEIGGGYLFWLWLREGKSIWLAALGGLILCAYGVIPTLQPAPFARVYAAYGGIFIALSMLWGWSVEGSRPDFWDWVGGLIAIVGASIVMYAPRGG
jgi:small multidrug resistance family-3 protein